MSAIFVLVAALVSLFAGYPIIQFYSRAKISTFGAYNVGGINASGQIPDIPGLPTLIDADTPASALTRTGFDGQDYVLAFSDEFNTDGRTFWEAVDLHYWATGDFEWYDPDAATTKGGNLVLSITEEPIHDLNFRSGMLQSWNKFCFTGGYIEVNLMLPGSPSISGLWPGAWTMGNLARAGYGATTDGTWPYSYNTCDIGTLKNQTNVAGTGPQAALTGGSTLYGGTGALSYLPGQRLSACTCAGGDHPGPNVQTGRGSPEIDILEAQVSYLKKAFHGAVSQSAQFAPFDDGYEFLNATPQTTVYDEANTYINTYKGGVYQEAVSAVTYTDPTAYELNGGNFATYGWESYPHVDNGYLTWQVSDQPAWQITSASVGPNAPAQIGQRLISEEPMYIILNLGLSSSFQTINYADLTFPAHMLVDYVRVYQRADSPNIGCDPPGMPTSKYIQSHLNAYSNPNFTTWEEAGYTFPKNSMEGC
ncbi:beta-glucan synthesis-associated protein KRE6, partial [Phenoliferia sp. Uapishka_3]